MSTAFPGRIGIMFNRIQQGLWWDRALTLVEGCTPVSEGCQHCWAAQQTYVRSHQKNPKIRSRYEGLTKDKNTFNSNVRLIYSSFDLPFKIKKPTVWAVWNDFFHPQVPLEFQVGALRAMTSNPQHIFIILTKREKQLAKFNRVYGWSEKAYPNIWLGVSVENQKRADERIPILCEIPASVIVVSYEPALGGLILPPEFLEHGRRAWTICGGETGHGARPMLYHWAQRVKNQCFEIGVPFFLKSHGEWRMTINRAREGDFCRLWGIANKNIAWISDGLWDYRLALVGKKEAGRLLDGRTWDQVPEVKDG